MAAKAVVFQLVVDSISVELELKNKLPFDRFLKMKIPGNKHYARFLGG